MTRKEGGIGDEEIEGGGKGGIGDEEIEGGGGWIGKPRPVKPAGLPSCYYADVDVPSNQNYAMLTTPGPCSSLPRAIQSATTIVQSHRP